MFFPIIFCSSQLFPIVISSNCKSSFIKKRKKKRKEKKLLVYSRSDNEWNTPSERNNLKGATLLIKYFKRSEKVASRFQVSRVVVQRGCGDEGQIGISEWPSRAHSSSDSSPLSPPISKILFSLFYLADRVSGSADNSLVRRSMVVRCSLKRFLAAVHSPLLFANCLAK